MTTPGFMLTTGEARQRVLDNMTAFGTESVGLELATGRILAERIRAERDQPPFDRVTMDGIAIDFAAFESGRRRFRIAGTQHAGDPARTLDDPEACIEVMTGTSMPDGADTVIAVERITVANGMADIEDGYAPGQGQFIHRQGSDHRRGTEVLSPGHRIAPVDIAVIASCGLNSIDVARAPVIRVVSTGNELVEPGQAIAPHQIRLSNGPAIVSMLASAAFVSASHLHLPDDPKTLEDRIARLLDEADVLVLSGGVSMGKADFVPKVLDDLGVEVVFHKISQRPGKPMWFGLGSNGQAVFALPGNPVSSLVCCRQYVLPALFHASGRANRSPYYAALSGDVEFPPDLTCFLPVRIESRSDGRLVAEPVPTNTSGDFTALSGTDGYVELAREKRRFPAGSVVPFHAWDAA